MNRKTWITALWGIAILLLGIAILLFNFGVFEAYALYGAYAVAAVLSLGGLAFLIALVFNTERWVLTIPGFTLLSLGVVVFLSTLDTIAPEYMGALFLIGLALGFLVLFLSNRQERWWALLQACIVAVVALVGVGVGVLPVEQLGSLLFGGLGLSFLLLYLVGGNHKVFAWTLIVAAVLLIFAAALLAASFGTESLVVRLWPILLVLIGGFILARAITGRAAPASPEPTPIVPAEVIEGTVVTAGASTEPAQIIRPEGFSVAEPLPYLEPQPVVNSTTPSPEPEISPEERLPPATAAPEDEAEGQTETSTVSMPDDLAAFDASDPAAALDALLEASQKVESDEA